MLCVKLLLSTATSTCALPITPAPTQTQVSIIGGGSVDISQVPYQVALVDPNSQLFCGGVIIAADLVLTAQHCSLHSTSTRVVAGVTNIQTWISDPNAQALAVDSIVNYPYYGEAEQGKDFAVLRVAQPGFVFNTNVQPIAMLTYAQSRFIALPGAQAFVSGWGTESNGQFASTLQRVSVVLFSNAFAAQALNETISYDELPAGLLSGGADACQGDSGGPLTVMVGSTPVLVGLVSWGRGCGLPDTPGVYARVSAFQAWTALVVRALNRSQTAKSQSVTLVDAALPTFNAGDTSLVSFNVPAGALRLDASTEDAGSALAFFVTYQAAWTGNTAAVECAAVPSSQYPFDHCTLVNPPAGTWFVTVSARFAIVVPTRLLVTASFTALKAKRAATRPSQIIYAMPGRPVRFVGPAHFTVVVADDDNGSSIAQNKTACHHQCSVVPLGVAVHASAAAKVQWTGFAAGLVRYDVVSWAGKAAKSLSVVAGTRFQVAAQHCASVTFVLRGSGKVSPAECVCQCWTTVPAGATRAIVRGASASGRISVNHAVVAL